MSVTKVKVARPFISKSKVSSSLYSQLVALLVAVIRERAAHGHSASRSAADPALTLGCLGARSGLRLPRKAWFWSESTLRWKADHPKEEHSQPSFHQLHGGGWRAIARCGLTSVEPGLVSECLRCPGAKLASLPGAERACGRGEKGAVQRWQPFSFHPYPVLYGFTRAGEFFSSYSLLACTGPAGGLLSGPRNWSHFL